MPSPAGIPDQWTLNANPAKGTLGSIVLPAATGIAHVLTHITARVVNDLSSGVQATILEVLDGATVIWAWQMILPASSATQQEFDSFDNDVFLMGAGGSSMTVQFTGTNASLYQMLSITGHDT